MGYLTDKARLKVQDFSFDIDPELMPLSPEKEEASRDIVKTKRFNVEVMTPIEATMQMDLLGTVSLSSRMTRPEPSTSFIAGRKADTACLSRSDPRLTARRMLPHQKRYLWQKR